MIYFDHDTSASKDTKIVCLRNRCGGAAVDGYWTILETIYQNECGFVFGENQAETEALTIWLGVGFDCLNNWVNEMINLGLLVVNDEGENASGFFKLITSERAKDNISEYKAKREIARQNGKKGGRKPNPNPTLTESVKKENQTLTQPLTNKSKSKSKSKEKDVANATSKKNASDPLFDDEFEHPFALQCIAELNAVMGTTYGDCPPSVAGWLEAQADRYTLEDVRKMLEFKRDEWIGTKWQRNLTPTCLFGSNHFESYISQSKMPRVQGGERDVDLGEFAMPVGAVF